MGLCGGGCTSHLPWEEEEEEKKTRCRGSGKGGGIARDTVAKMEKCDLNVASLIFFSDRCDCKNL